MASTGIKFKQGTSLQLQGRYLDDAGAPKALTGVILKSQVRSGDTLIDDLVYAVIDEANGWYTLTAAKGTSSYPVGTLTWDIKESVAGVDRFTQTSTMLIETAVTR